MSSRSIPLPKAIPHTVLGVFAYMDQVLTTDQRHRFATEDLGLSPQDLQSPSWGFWSEARHLLWASFPLKVDDSPLSADLSAFRLYYSWDRADALLTAYGLRCRGLDPMPALMADYAIRNFGILRWADMDELYKEAVADPTHPYRLLYNLLKPGDRVVHYSRPTNIGLLLVRGDRLVCEVPTMHMSYEESPMDGWAQRMADWKGKGGSKDFFENPPEK